MSKRILALPGISLIVPTKGQWRSGKNCTIDKQGYLRVKGPMEGEWRDEYYHRAKAKWAMRESGKELGDDESVNHLCGTRDCSCPDFHLLIMPCAMKDVLDSGKGRPSRRRKNFYWPHSKKKGKRKR